MIRFLYSNPSFSATRKALKPAGFKAFSMSKTGCFPLCFPFTASKQVISGHFVKIAVIVLHPGGGVLHHLFRRMRVHVQGEGRRSVAQHTLNAFHVSPGSDCNRRRRVSEVVGPRVRPPDACDDLLEVTVEGEYGKVAADLVCEHEVVGVVPQSPGV